MTTDTTDQAKNAFLAALTDLRGGETLAELHHALIQLVGDVRSIGKTGKLTLTLNVALAKGSTATILVTDELKLSEPKPDKEVTIMFADDNNRVSRRDPRQPDLTGLAEPGEVKAFPRRQAVNEEPTE